LNLGDAVGVVLDSRGGKGVARLSDLVRVANFFGVWVCLILEAPVRGRHAQEAHLQAHEANPTESRAVRVPGWIARNFFPETHGRSF